jgi:hypothetical protein
MALLKNVPLFGLGTTGKSLPVNAQKRTNLYVEIQQDPEANGLVMYPTPGLTRFVNLGANPSRGAYERSNLMYQVAGSALYEITANGTSTIRGTLDTAGGRVDMADNGTQLLIVDGSFGYIYNFSTFAFTKITAPGFQASDTCAFLNGYFIVQRAGTGQFAVSDLYDGLAWDALAFATSESDPDNLVRVFVDAGTVILFGDKTTEFWSDSGALDFPFSRVGLSGIEWGLASRWSVTKFDNSLMFLRKNRLGGAVQVCRLAGNSTQVVSTPELDYVFSNYTNTANATAFSYMQSGHHMYCINFPSANESWEYDGLTQEWHKRSTNDGRYAGEIQVNYLNKAYVSDYENGKIYLIDQNVFTDDGQTIVREFVSRHNKNGDFVRISQLWLEMESGIGLTSGQGSDPQLMMQISRDGGKTWGNEIWRSFGKIGANRVRALFNSLGRSRDWLFRFRVTDPVKTVFIAAWAKYGQ